MTMEFASYLVLFYAVFHACATAFVAETKNRSVLTWLVLGGIFGVFALRTVGLAEKREESPEEKKSKEILREKFERAGKADLKTE